MTRINLIDPKDLSDKHLMAEYRELAMIAPALVKSLKAKTPLKIPKNFTLNKGHVKFFYNKKKFLQERLDFLCLELLNREYDINPFERNFRWDVFDNIEQINYAPTKKDIFVSLERILDRLSFQKHTYFKEKIDDNFIISLKKITVMEEIMKNSDIKKVIVLIISLIVIFSGLIVLHLNSQPKQYEYGKAVGKVLQERKSVK